MTLAIKHGCTKSNPCSLRETQNNDNNGDHKQQVDQPSQGVGADQAKEPENDQKNGDRFKHGNRNATEVNKVVKMVVNIISSAGSSHPCRSGDGAHPGYAWRRDRQRQPAAAQNPDRHQPIVRLCSLDHDCAHWILSAAREVESPSLPTAVLTPCFRSDPACMAEA